MGARQTVPRQWLIIAGPVGRRELALARSLALRSGLLLLEPAPRTKMRVLRQIARQRDLVLVEEHPRSATRVHDIRELRRALLQRTALILVSPLFPTQSHPDRRPLPRMRAAALARLGDRKLLALGGVDARKFARIRPLGFQAWAGISAFRT